MSYIVNRFEGERTYEIYLVLLHVYRKECVPYVTSKDRNEYLYSNKNVLYSYHKTFNICRGLN